MAGVSWTDAVADYTQAGDGASTSSWDSLGKMYSQAQGPGAVGSSQSAPMASGARGGMGGIARTGGHRMVGFDGGSGMSMQPWANLPSGNKGGALLSGENVNRLGKAYDRAFGQGQDAGGGGLSGFGDAAGAAEGSEAGAEGAMALFA